TRRAPIPLDDGRLERLLAQLRYPQPYLASFGLQAALVVSGAGIPTRLAALIALRIAQPIRLGIEQCVQRLLHGTPHHPVEVALDPRVANRDDIVQRLGVRLTWRLPLAGLVVFSHLQFSQIRGRQPYSIVRKILYVIPEIGGPQALRGGVRSSPLDKRDATSGEGNVASRE